jgi:hypothetical protein
MDDDHDWGEIRRYYEAGHSVREACERFRVTAGAWKRAVGQGLLPAPDLPPMQPSEKRALIGTLSREGCSRAMIAAELGMSNATVSYHARRLGLPVNDDFARRYDWVEVQKAHDAGMRALECCRHFGFNKATWSKAVATGRIEVRSHLIPLEELLVRGRRTGRSHLKARLIEAGLKENRCEQCGISAWRGLPLNVQLHHKNGEGTDNRAENLQFLCPNCHSQTRNYGGRKRNQSNRHLRLVEPPQGDREAVA